MKNWFILTLVIFAGACTPDPQQQMETFVKDFFSDYPKATLQDFYKGNFQDFFGPAHLLTDREAVKNYILQEMESTESFETEDYRPCGWQSQFYQVNLSVIRDGRISMDEFADAFIESANGINANLTPAWIDEWKALQQAVRKVVPKLEGFAEDSTRLARLLDEGKYVVHHSRVFNLHYHPHYRIIRKDIFEERIRPKLKAK